MGGGSVTDIQWVETKDVAKHPIMHGEAPYNKE